MTSLVKLHIEVCTHVFSYLFIFQLIKSEGGLCPSLEDPWLLALESVNLVQIDSVLLFM